MKHTDRLFQLIQSLSKNEKGYFMKMTAGEKPQYIYLFKALDKLDSYDEEKLVKKLKKYVEIKHLGSTKSYLYHLILKTLRNYKARTSLRVDVLGQIQDIEFLYDKGLFEDCLKKITALKQIVWESGLFSNYFYLALMEFSVILNTLSYRKHPEQINQLLDELQSHYHEYGIFLLHVKTANIQITNSLYSKDLRQTQADIKKKQKLIKQLTEWEKQVSHDVIKIDIYKQLDHLYSLIPDYQTHIHYVKKRLKTWKENLSVQRAYPGQYEEASILYIFNQLRIRKDKSYILPLKELRQQLISSRQQIPEFRFLIILSYLMIGEILLYCNLMMHDELNVLIEESEPYILLARKKEIVSRWYLSLYSTIGVFFFEIGNFEKALEYFNGIIENPKQVDQTPYLTARIAHLICHYELNNTLYLSSAIRSFYRHIRTQEAPFKLEACYIKYMAILLKTTDKKDLNNVFISFRSEIEALRKEPMEARVINYFPYIAWLTSKIERRPFIDVVQEIRSKKTL